MAKKEERILVLTTNNEDGECECVTQDGCHVNDSCAICNVGMTHKEAIKIIVKRLKYEGVNKFECHSIAKWCLDALLRGGK